MGLPVREMNLNSKLELFKSIEQMQFKQRQNVVKIALFIFSFL